MYCLLGENIQGGQKTQTTSLILDRTYMMVLCEKVISGWVVCEHVMICGTNRNKVHTYAHDTQTQNRPAKNINQLAELLILLSILERMQSIQCLDTQSGNESPSLYATIAITLGKPRFLNINIDITNV